MAASSTSPIISSFFLVGVLLSCFAPACLSYYCASDGLRYVILDHDDDDPSFATLMSLPTEAIYQFGDSISDTGNLVHGRFSNGLLMIDYFAKHLKLPLIEPYLKKDGNFGHGVDFAVGGATALDVSTLAEKYNVFPSTNLSLSVQLRWFKSYLHSSSFNASELRRKFAKALFFMGEIGGNDYNYAFIDGQRMTDVYKMVPQVIEAIKIAVEEIIDLGATRIAVPGNFPVGCMTIYLSLFKTNDSTMYDELKCLKNFNKFAQFHNDKLQESIEELKKSHPNVTIVYVDLYSASREILQDATNLGFNKDEMFKACCGDGDDEYNVNLKRNCGSDGVSVCENPDERVSWDGSHLTQHAYQEMASWLITHSPSAIRPQLA